MRPDQVKTTISVVIVTFNSLGVIDECLHPLNSCPHEDVHVIVVDNASTDGTPEHIERRYPDITLIRAESNDGFAAGVIEGVSASTSEVIVLLNPDAVVATDTLRALADQMQSEATLGILAPAIIQPAGRLRITSAGRFPTAWRMFTHYAGLSRYARRVPLLEGHYLRPEHVTGECDTDWVTGACLAMRRTVWDEIGGISRRWFMYAEDIDLCLRVKRAGYRVVLSPTWSADHLVGASESGHERRLNAAWVINLFDFYCLEFNPGPVRRSTWRLIVGIGLASRAVAYLLRARGPGRAAWRTEARRFFFYAKATLTAKAGEHV